MSNKTTIIILIIITLALSYFIYLERTKKILFFDRMNSIKIKQIYSGSSMETLNKNIPKPFNGMTISFGILIDTFFFNDGMWRHIMHKGDSFQNTEFKKWKDVKKIKNQFPGVWLNPEINSIRIAFLVNNKLEHKDISNIPINKVVYITLVLDENSLLIYRDGKLLDTKVFMNNPTHNKGDFYFCHPKTFSGKLINFLYYNQPVSNNGVKAILNKKKKINL